jgi:membrane protein YqaA with SNARE-associated domain
LKKKLITIYLKYQAYIWSLLSPLGIWGPGIISAIDSAAFGIPMDIVMIGYAAREREHLLLVAFYCVTAAMGSAIGSLVPYWLGRRGGEPFLLKRISHAKLERMRDRFEKQEFLFILFPSMLPPPTPFKMLVFCAGVFEMKVGQFIAAIVIGRTLRFAIVSYITIRFGETIAKQVLATVAQHLPWVLAAFLLAFALYFVYWMRGRKGREEMLEI